MTDETLGYPEDPLSNGSTHEQEVGKKIAEGFQYFQPARYPRPSIESELRSEEAELPPPIAIYFAGMRSAFRIQFDQQLIELVDTFGEDNVWVGPSLKPLEASTAEELPSTLAFYVRMIVAENDLE